MPIIDFSSSPSSDAVITWNRSYAPSNPYTAACIGLKTANPDPFKTKGLRGKNGKPLTWGPWQLIREVYDTELVYFLYHELMDYEIELKSKWDIGEILDWVMHMSGKNVALYGNYSPSYLSQAFRCLLAHRRISMRSLKPFDMGAVAHAYWTAAH